MKNIPKKNSDLKNTASPSREFAPILRRAGITAWLCRLLPIPIDLYNARLLSRTVASAVSGDSGGVLRSGGFLLLLLALAKAFDFLANAAYGRLSSRALHQCRQLLYRRFLSCPLSLLHETKHGQATEMLNDDFDTVTEKFLNLYPGFFTGFATLLAYFSFLLAQSLTAALALLVISLLQAVPPLVVKRFLEKNYGDTREIEARITDCTLEYYHGFACIKMYGLKHWCLNRLALLHKDYLVIGNRSEAACQAELTLKQLTGNILTYGTYGLMGLFVLRETMALETAVEAIALSQGFYAAAKTIFDTIPAFAVAGKAETRIAAFYYNEESAPGETMGLAHGVSDSEKLYGTNPCIRFDHVSCSFEGRQVLNDFSLSLPADRTVLIRGANGMGKSTLLRLALGLIKPGSGDVSMGGIPSCALPPDSFPEKIFYLPQEDPVFHVSAEELYAMVPGVETLEALSFAYRFRLQEEQWKQPIDTLSGGQRKKVFLALALALHPGLLLLDEPGNSLDGDSREILAGLLKQRGGGTLIVTHDSAFDRLADVFHTLG